MIEYLAIVMYCLSMKCTPHTAEIEYKVSERIPFEKCYETLYSIYKSTSAGRPKNQKWHMLCVQADLWEEKHGVTPPTHEGTI
jgi:hypothetical protein